MRKGSIFSIFILILLSGLYTSSYGQRRSKIVVKKISIYDVDSLLNPVPRQRQLWHDKIDKEQKRANAGLYSEDSLYTKILTRAIIKDVNHLQVMIENLPSKGEAFTDNQNKILYLRAVWQMLSKFNSDTKVDPVYYKKLVINMHDMIIAHYEGKLIEFSKTHVSIQSIENGEMLLDKSPEARAYIYEEMGKQDPRLMIKHLNEFADEPYAQPVIADAAKVLPNEIFNYASSTNFKLRSAVRRSTDPLVVAIVEIADRSKFPLKAMAFLTDIYHKRKTIAQIDSITNNPDLYYRNLVRLKIENDSLGGMTYTDELSYRGLRYIREMNDLHESPDAVRFKCIEGMSPVALYFLMVYGQDEIYTSSFLGTFKRMMERQKPKNTNELLDTLHDDHFRTFIRMCAGYNTLNEFLSAMPDTDKTNLMQSFIAGLGKGKDDDLEDAVDVADAFGSIRDSALSSFLKLQVKRNYEASYRKKSKKGMIVYALLATLFEGAKSDDNDTSAIRQSETLRIPPINMVPFKKLLNDSGVVYEQFFFFGDEDGKTSYASFLGNFRDGKWKITTEKQWAVISSTTGKPIVIYANLPIPEPGDEEAQDALGKYLDLHEIHPTIIVHRGHSYHLPLTMDKLTKYNKIVMLGSCGGYHNLAVVLDHSPDAHIISSKQTGTMAVNEPIIKAINDQLLLGNDINWIKIWRELNEYFEKKKDVKEKFSDYVPPYKNLGAIFIKSYRRISNTGPTDE